MNNTAIAGLGHNSPPEPMQVLTDDLNTRHKPLIDEARNLAMKGKELLATKIEDDETCGKYSDLVKEFAASIKKLESTRVAEVEPHLAGQRTVNGLFKKIIDAMDKTKRDVSLPITNYLNEKVRKERAAAAEAADIARKAAEAQLQTAVQMEDAGMVKQADNILAKAENLTAQAVKLENTVAAKPAVMSQTRGDSSLASLKTVWKGTIIDIGALDLEKLRTHISVDALEKAVNSFVRAGGRELTGARITEEATAAIR